MNELNNNQTFLGQQFELLIKELEESGLKVNKNFEDQNNENELKVSFIKKKSVNVSSN
tara:strand:- start:552 stop:725 length:174 start_codon:yes stop_codon:yes gene_type:complete